MPTVIIPPTDVSPYTGTGDQVLATNPVFPSNITVNGTTDSSSKDTGAIVTEGGLGVEKSASIGGNLTVSATTASTNDTSGAFQVIGGAGLKTSAYINTNGDTGRALVVGPVAQAGGNFPYASIKTSASFSDFALGIENPNTTAGQGLGLRIVAGAAANDFPIYVRNQANNSTLFSVGGTGNGTLAGNLTVSGGTIGTAASTNLTLNGGSSGASLALGQGTNGTFTFTLPSISAGNTTWVSAGAVGIGIDFKRATAAATLGVTLASLNGYNGATRAAIFEFNGDGATDSGRFDWWVKPTAGSLTQAMVLKSNGNLLLGTTTDVGPRLLSKAKDNTYAGSGIGIVDQSAGTSYITRANGTFYISNNGSTDHFSLNASGTATIFGNLTVSGAGLSSFGGLTTFTQTDVNDTRGISLLTSGAGNSYLGNFARSTYLTQNAYYSSGWVIPDTTRTTGSFTIITSQTANAGQMAWGLGSVNTSPTNLMTLTGGTVGTGVLAVLGTTDSTSTTTGALTVAGGVGIAKKLYVGDDATFAGDVTVSGGNMGVGIAASASIALAVTPSTLTGNTQYGVAGYPVFSSAATAAGYSGYFEMKTAASAFTMAVGRSIFVEVPLIGAGSAITTQSGIYVSNQGAGSITNAYGIDIAAQSGATTTNIGLRNLGATVLATPAAAVTLATNSTMTFELTSNTSLTIKVRGTDGTTRSVALTLA